MIPPREATIELLAGVIGAGTLFALAAFVLAGVWWALCRLNALLGYWPGKILCALVFPLPLFLIGSIYCALTGQFQEYRAGCGVNWTPPTTETPLQRARLRVEAQGRRLRAYVAGASA